MGILEIKEGKPYIWRTLNYGDIAVHLLSVGPKGVLKVTIDGGEASTPAQRFPELADGIGFTLAKNLFARPTRRRQSATEVASKIKNRKLAEAMKPLDGKEITF